MHIHNFHYSETYTLHPGEDVCDKNRWRHSAEPGQSTSVLTSARLYSDTVSQVHWPRMLVVECYVISEEVRSSVMLEREGTFSKKKAVHHF